MGMDAMADIFYGYKDPDLDVDYDNLPEYLTIVDDSQGNQYLAVVGSNTRFDWDYGAQEIFPQSMYDDEERYSYYKKIKDFLTSVDEEFCGSKIGWFIICDYV